MMVYYGTFDIPEWAIHYLLTKETYGISSQQIDCINNFIEEIKESCEASNVWFDMTLMDVDKYGTFYKIQDDLHPAFGEEFGECVSWSLPCHIETKCYENMDYYDILVSGRKAFGKNYEVHIFKNRFHNEDEARMYVESYYSHLEWGYNVVIEPSGRMVVNDKLK